MIILYHDPVSSNSWKVRLVLAEKRLPYELVVFDIRHKRDQPEYLAIHPYGQVPAIVDDGFAVYDSTLINEYLEERYPEIPLMPPDARGRARQRMLEDYRDNHFHVDFIPLLVELRNKPPGQADPGVVGAAWAAVVGRMARLEAALEGRDYLGPSFSTRMRPSSRTSRTSTAGAWRYPGNIPGCAPGSRAARPARATARPMACERGGPPRRPGYLPLSSSRTMRKVRCSFSENCLPR